MAVAPYISLEMRKEMSIIPIRAASTLFRASLLCGAFYLALKGLIKINNIATLETLPLEDGLQLFVILWNEGTNSANIFSLAMIQERLN